MPKVCRFVCLATLFVTTGLAASAQVEVLYVSGTQTTAVPLDTYNVDTQTAVATQVGTMTVGGSSVDPVTVGGRHLVYVWNGTDVWMYLTNAKGVPENKASQHLTFGFLHPVTSFVADPKGNFAYAGLTWSDSKYNNYAAVVLFTIDQSTGKLTNTGREVATYGPDPYISLSRFMFGASGNRLYAYYFNNGPYTCIVGYDYYTVNQTSGKLGPRTTLTYGEASCNTDGGVAITDQVAAADSSCCGQGSGYLNINQTMTGKNIACQAVNLTFCGDQVYFMYVDPASQNLFFGDADAHITYVGHFDFANSQLIETGSTIQGNPPVFFSPDSRLVYAVNGSDIGIYTLQSSSGVLGASSSIPQGNKVNIATATLK
jgi:hypothetical protein